MTAKVHREEILPDAPQRRASRRRRGKQALLKSNALKDGVAWLFEALRATDYFDERILRAHERLPMPEREKMARAYYDVLPPYEQILIYRAASLPNTFYRCASIGKSDGRKIGLDGDTPISFAS